MVLLKDALPGSIPFLLISLLAGLILLQGQRARRWGYWWLWGLFLIYLGFSMPIGSSLISAPLACGFTSLQRAEEAHGVRAIVVLDGGTQRYHDSDHFAEFPDGSSAMRALEAARIYRLLDKPLIIVSGGNPGWRRGWNPEASALRDLIIRLGVPPQRVTLDSNSENTRASALNLAHLLRGRGIKEFVLVTSPTHIRRAIFTFRAVGTEPIPSPSASPIDDKRGWDVFLPSREALLTSEQAMHDYLGLIYYWLRGWI